MELDWRTTLLLITSVPSLGAAIWAFFLSRETIAARFFLALVAAWVWHAMPYTIGFSDAIDAYPRLTFFPFNMELWFGPLWLLLVLAMTQQDLPKRWWLWLIPGLVQFTYYSVCFFGLPDLETKFAYNDSFHEPVIVRLEMLVGLGLIAYAAVVTSRRLWQYRAWIAKEHANRKRVDLSWLGRALLAIVLLALVWMLSDFIQQVFGQWSYAINFYVYLFAAIMFLAMSLDFLSKVDRLYPKYGPASEREVSSPKAQNDDQIDLDALRSKVRSRGWHLDPDLSLNDLARHLATNKSTLSAWLNSEEDGNFSTFVNGLRVDEVCERLKAAKEKPNLLLIAFQCGFGSKATFNRAFKQQTGQSPRDWLRALDKEFAA